MTYLNDVVLLSDDSDEDLDLILEMDSDEEEDASQRIIEILLMRKRTLEHEIKQIMEIVENLKNI